MTSQRFVRCRHDKDVEHFGLNRMESEKNHAVTVW